LSRKIIAFAPILWLKNEAEFTLGVEQQHASNNMKKYLSSPSVMKAPIAGIPLRLYIIAVDGVIGVVLMPVSDGKEHIITYLRQCLMDAEARYSFIESYVYPCFMLALNQGTTCYIVLV
jgi:hypothetical protein